MESEPRHIVLVHGTILVPWLMRGPAWIGDEHPFRRQLAGMFPRAQVVPFRWRGGNLHADRLRAAHALAAEIDGRDGPMLLIGHSHGGNVARMALQLAQERDAETQLVTLATPFLNVRWHIRDWTGRRRPHVGWQSWGSFIWSAALGLLVMLSLVAGVRGTNPLGGNVNATPGEGPKVSPWMSDPLIVGVWAAGVTLVLAVLLAIGFGLLQGIGGALIARTNRGLGLNHGHDWLTDADTREPGGALAAARAEVVAVENDEAAWSLNLGQAAGSIGAALGSSGDVRRIHGRTRLILNLLVTAGVLLGLVQPLGWRFDFAALTGDSGWQVRFPALKLLGFVQEGSGFGDEVLAVVGVLLIAFGLLGLVGIAIQLFEYLTAGWDSLVVADRARLSVSTAPPGRSSVTLLDLSCGRRHGLRHSRIYEEEPAVDAVLALVRRTTTTAVGPARAA